MTDLTAIKQGAPFKSWKRPASAPQATEIVIHESVTTSVSNTVKVLQGKGLGVHYIVDRDGSVTQHVPLTHYAAHAGYGHNLPSIAIEVVNAYYPSKAPAQAKIKAAWAHKGEYILPTPLQCEAVWGLVKALCDTLKIKLDFPGADLRSGTFRWGRIGSHLNVGGVMAHHRWDHADGLFVEHYCVLRSRGYAPEEAFGLTLVAAQNVPAIRVTRLPSISMVETISPDSPSIRPFNR